MTISDIDLANRAETQDGITTRTELRDAGLTDKSIDRKIAAGLLIPVFAGVYRVAGYPKTWQGDLRAAFLWGGEGALITGASALALRGIEGFDSPIPDLYVASTKRCEVVKTRRLPTSRIPSRPHSGMRTTSIERALLDACTTHQITSVGIAMDDALRRGLTSTKKLVQEAEANSGKGRRGVKAFRMLIALRDPDDQKVRSVMETKMLRIIRRISSHRFVPNLEVLGRKRYLLDFGVAEVRVGIECHSRSWHGTGRVGPDLARHRDLTLMGWTILYFSWEDIVCRPEEVERDIKAALASSLAI